ncbi:TonB-dependent receptor [uncultured Winogradskyella sp.]|uniref:TonB-dependent receptor n=1 Tax=uncultured Winogradskyella sp. TaxID=395353 RepID=UPI0030D870FA|tara:strand:+ start:24597 stop:27407 length:2811 start_codon:yes stop_codon:yes gene_type:complete
MKSLLLFLFILIFCISTYAQHSLKGRVLDVNNTPITNAHVKLQLVNLSAFTDLNGDFNIDQLSKGNYVLTITYLGFKTINLNVEIKDKNLDLSTIFIEEDLINLDNIVITGSNNSRRQMESGISITTLKSKTLQEQFSIGTADLLQNIPGIITDASAGEVYTRVISRGLSASATDDLGWYYVSLQEDGLPISLIQHSYYSPDIFHRLDLMTEKVEALRGGNSVISATNAPAGVYNFISHGISNSLRGELQLDGALAGTQNESFKIDGLISGPIANDWYFNFGGHYRRDDGSRNTDFIFSKGGQVKFNIMKKTEQMSLKFYGKILNDFTNRYTGVAAVGWDNPEAAFGQDLNTTALMMPSFNGEIPDGRNLDSGETNSFNPSNGVHAQDYAFGIHFQQELANDWALSYNGKFSRKIADWQTSISNAFVSLSDPLAYFISGADFPVGQVVFRDARSDSEVASVDNSGILSGNPFTYINEGSLPNDAIMGTAAWYKYNTANEWIDQFQVSKRWKKHDLNFGTALGLSNSNLFTQGSFGYATYEPNPRMLRVTLENPNTETIALSDENGLSNYGGLFYINGEARVQQLSVFANDRYTINQYLTLDFGLRYENISHKGHKDRYAPSQTAGGFDMDESTAYDNGILSSTGSRDTFDFTYDYVSFSAGLNYRFTDDFSVFTSYSYGNKAPELDYYFNNFTNVPIQQEGEVQEITQLELGLNWRNKDISATLTGFLSRLNKIGVSNFEFDSDESTVFYTPIQFNSSTSIGLELESAYSPINNLTFRLNGTIQNAKAREWTIYDTAGTVDIADDNIIDQSGKTLPFMPTLAFNFRTEYRLKNLSSFFKWQYTGEREGNIANAFQMPQFSLFNVGFKYAITKNFSTSLAVTNLFNSAGITNFFGANSFGANADGVTSDFVQANPDASFVVVPVLPRRTILRFNYNF